MCLESQSSVNLTFLLIVSTEKWSEMVKNINWSGKNIVFFVMLTVTVLGEGWGVGM